jgi:hypothetical protein
MNIKKKKLLALAGVGFITFLTNAPSLTSVYGALSAPASYDLNYQYSSSLTRFVIGTSSVGTISPIYQATADGAYTNYSAILTSASNSGGILPQGLDITMTFNRSNTSWQGVGPTPFVNWRPNDTKIGSDATVGSVINKVLLTFNNQTNIDYQLYFDNSSSTGSQYYHYNIGTFTVGGPTVGGDLGLLTGIANMNELFIPAYTQVHFFKPSSSSVGYFDAWYLKDLGINGAYDVGYDAGYIQGQDDADLLITGFQAMVGILVNFVLMIVNLEVFGVSILGIFSIIVLFTTIVWVLKLIRG